MRSRLILFAASITASALFAGTATGASIHSSSDTFLAIDQSVFERIDGMSLTLHEARKHPANPLLKNRPEGPDAWRAGFPWVLLDKGKFRMWYLARDSAGDFFTCYAESDDGYEWSRPALGIIEHRGSKDNNICYKGHTLFPQIYRDDTATDPARRYIGVIYGLITAGQMTPAEQKRYGQSQPSIKCLAYSPDGLHWQEDHGSLFPIHAKIEGGTLYRMGRDWFMVHQQNSAEYPEVNDWSRFLSISHSTDLKTWKLGDKPGFFFDPRFGGIIQTHVTPGLQNYGNVIVGAQGLFYNNEELIDHETELMLILTNDGRTWRQPKPSQPFSYLLRRGQPHEWDRSFIVQGNFVNTGSQTRMYYNGSQWGNVDADGIQIGLAELRLDGYGSLAPKIGWEFGKEGPFEGTVVSKPIAVEKPGLRLYLNLRAGKDSRDAVAVELTDADGAALAGYGFGDSANMNLDSVGAPVSWRGRSDLIALAGKQVKVKIRITAHNRERSGKVRAHEPHLFAFYFAQPHLLLGKEQVAGPSGLERQHVSDPQHPVLQDVSIVSTHPIKVTLTELSAGTADLTFTGSGQVSIMSPTLGQAEVGGKTVRASDGALRFEVNGSARVQVRLASGGKGNSGS